MDIYVLYADNNTIRDREVTLNSIKIGKVTNSEVYLYFGLYVKGFLKLLGCEWKKMTENPILDNFFNESGICFPIVTYSISFTKPDTSEPYNNDVFSVKVNNVNFGSYEFLKIFDDDQSNDNQLDDNQREYYIDIINEMLEQLGIIDRPLPKDIDKFKKEFNKVKDDVKSELTNNLNTKLNDWLSKYREKEYVAPLFKNVILDNNPMMLCITPMRIILEEIVYKDTCDIDVYNTYYNPSIWIKKDLFDILKQTIIETLNNPVVLPSCVSVENINTTLNIPDGLTPTLSHIFSYEFGEYSQNVSNIINKILESVTSKSTYYVEVKHTKSRMKGNTSDYVIYDPIISKL